MTEIVRTAPVGVSGVIVPLLNVAASTAVASGGAIVTVGAVM